MEHEKKVDESWKEAAAQEKEQKDMQSANAKDAEVPTVDFINYVTSLVFQGMIFMGDIPNPITNQMEKNVKQAKFIIDTLVMMRDKTQGNLSEQEEGLLSTSIYELQTKYVAHVQQDQQTS